MCRAMEEMRAEAAHDKAVEIAKFLLRKRIGSIEDIAEGCKLSISEVKVLAKQQNG